VSISINVQKSIEINRLISTNFGFVVNRKEKWIIQQVVVIFCKLKQNRKSNDDAVRKLCSQSSQN